MSRCKCAKATEEYGGYACTVSGSACIFLRPDSKRCSEEYGEGPDTSTDYCEDCGDFYLDCNLRCCKQEPLRLIDGDIIKNKYIEKNVVSCGGFRRGGF